MMMKVKKRNGTIQDFNMDKIRLALGRVSDELSMPFTGSDLKRLTDNIGENIEDTHKDIIESAEIYRIVIDNLRALGFKKMAKAYEDFERKF